MIRSHVLICGGTGCTSGGSVAIGDKLQQELVRLGLAEEIKIVRTGCFGLCQKGPIVAIYPDKVFYCHVKPEDVERMVPLTRTGVIFEISRAMENKKSDAAISLIDFQLERGENAITIMRAAFIPTLRNLLAARLLCDAFNLKPTNFKEFTARISSLPSYAAALIPLKKDGTPNAYPLFLAAQNASKFKTERLKQTLKECMKADKALVSSSLDPRLILHRLAICSAS